MNEREFIVITTALNKMNETVDTIAAGQTAAPARPMDTSLASGATKFAAHINQHPLYGEVHGIWQMTGRGEVHPKFPRLVSECLHGGAIVEDFRQAMGRRDCRSGIAAWDFVKLVQQEQAVRERIG